MSKHKVWALASVGWLALSSAALAAGPEVVQGPGADPECFTPWSADTKYFKCRPRKAPTGSRSPTASSAIPGVSR